MALQAFGPWEDSGTQTFQTAIHQGAQLGASLRQQDLSASEAGDRLHHAYATLAQQEDLANQKAAADREQQTLDRQLGYAKLSHDQEKNDLLNYYRQAHVDETAKHNQALEAAQSGNLDLRERRISDLENYRAQTPAWVPANAETGEPAHWNTRTGVHVPGAAALGALDKSERGAAIKDLMKLEKTIAAPVMPLTPQQEADNSAKAFGLRQKIAAYDSPQATTALALPGRTSATPAAAATPFKEGALIRSKKDGKLYRVKNGVPVPEEGF